MAVQFLNDVRLTAKLLDTSGDAGTSGQILSSTGTGTNWIPAPTGTVDGTGTANYLPKWSDTDTLTSSSFYESGTDLYIDQYIQHKGDNSYFGFGSNDTFEIGLSGGEKFRITSTGDVGIGTVSPTYKLDVVGAVGINTYIHHNDDTDTFIGFPNVDNFQVTVANVKELDVSAGIVSITNTLKYDNPTANSEFNGEIVNFGSFAETTAAGDLICLGTDAGSPVWRLANNGNSVDSTGMLGIAMGSNPDAGILVRGHARLAGYSALADGGKCYISSTNGDMTTTAPTGSGTYLRIVGYVVDSVSLSYGHIYFCPDNTWVEIA